MSLDDQQAGSQEGSVESLAGRTMQRLRKLFPSAAALRWFTNIKNTGFIHHQCIYVMVSSLQAIHRSRCGGIHEGRLGWSSSSWLSQTSLSSWDTPPWSWDWPPHEGIEWVSLSWNNMLAHPYYVCSAWKCFQSGKVQKSNAKSLEPPKVLERGQQRSRKVSQLLPPWPLGRERCKANLLSLSWGWGGGRRRRESSKRNQRTPRQRPLLLLLTWFPTKRLERVSLKFSSTTLPRVLNQKEMRCKGMRKRPIKISIWCDED